MGGFRATWLGRTTWLGLGLFLCAMPAGTRAQDMADAERQFRQACSACHAALAGAPNRQGPNLHDAFGRHAGTLEGFSYSNALKASGLVWDEATLDSWLTDSQKMQPGTLMAYRQRDPVKRQLVISYLKNLTGPN
jgi:cytochrome c